MRDAMLSPVSPPAPGPGDTGAPAQPDPGAALRGLAGPGRPRERRTLSRADWTAAALEALARDGLRAVAVEPLAERLGATKGSFYWHFRDRNALLESAVAQWERTAADEPLERLAAESETREPGVRQEDAARWPASEHDMRIFLVLLWNADHPAIGPAIARILAKRTAYSLRLREAAGEDPQSARRSVVHAYSLLIGLHMLRRAAPGLVPEGDTPDGLRDFMSSLVRQGAGPSVAAAV